MSRTSCTSSNSPVQSVGSSRLERAAYDRGYESVPPRLSTLQKPSASSPTPESPSEITFAVVERKALTSNDDFH